MYKWYWYVIAVIVVLSATSMFLQNRSVNYLASAKILIKPVNNGGSKLDASTETLGAMQGIAKPNLENEIEVLKSTRLVESAIRNLGCNTIVKEKTLFGEKEIYGNELSGTLAFRSIKDSSRFLSMALTKKPDGHIDVEIGKQKSRASNHAVFQTEGFTLFLNIGDAFLNKKLLVSWVPVPMIAKSVLYMLNARALSDNASVIALSLVDNLEQRDTLLLNALIDEYQRQNLNLKNRNLENSIDFLNERINEIKIDLGKIETEIKDYKVANKIFNIKGQSTSEEAIAMTEKTKIEQLNLKRMICDQILEYTNDPAKKYSLIPSSLGIEDATLLEIIKLYNTNALLREDLLKEAEARNTHVKAVEGRLNSLIQKIKENLLNIKTSIHLSIKQSEKEYLGIQKSLSGLPEKEKELASIERLQAIKEKLYLYLLQKKEEISLSLAGSESNSYVIQTATIENLLGASETTIWSASLMVAFLLPSFFIYLFHSLYGKLLTKADVESEIDFPVLGEISRSRNHRYLVVNGTERDIINEEFRVLRSNILFGPKDQKVKSILITSTTPNEGKSFVASNLGLVMALAGKKVVLLEMDLRKPKQYSIFKIDGKAKGIVHYLNNDNATLNDIVHPIGDQKNLFLVPCGVVPPNPSELLLSEKLRTLFDELNNAFDYIIIDTPPIGILSDAKAIAAHADLGLYILRQRFTSKKALGQLEKLVEGGTFHRFAVVINDIANKNSYDYEAYKYTKYSYRYTDAPARGLKGFFSGIVRKYR